MTMSWIVETLLLNSDAIREGVYSTDKYSTGEDAVESFFLDDDVFLDFLFLEKKMKEMETKGMFSDKEKEILNFVVGGSTYSSLEKHVGITRDTISKKFRAVCERIAFYIGGIFTDEGYLEYMKEKYNLTDHQVLLLESYMNSRFRHTIRRTPYEVED